MVYFSSDLHFNHNKPFIYEARGFNDIYEMNRTIINHFHEIVTPEDDLYLLGDIMLGPLEEGIKLYHQLPGKIHLIWGNHDTFNRQEALLQAWNTEDVIGYATVIKAYQYHFYLSHFPTCTTNFDDYEKPLKQRTLCIAGHTHSKELFE